jgi:exodeoxyribonuclease-3
MSFTLATWNINSVRLREGLVARLMTEEKPDILCLQEAADVFKFNDLTR